MNIRFVCFNEDLTQPIEGLFVGTARHSETEDLYEVWAALHQSNPPDINLGTWTHYKNNLYQVLGVAIELPTSEELVLYVPKYRNEGTGMSLRPFAGENGFTTPRDSATGGERFRWLYR